MDTGSGPHGRVSAFQVVVVDLKASPTEKYAR